MARWFSVSLEELEHKALWMIAKNEHRNIREQAAQIIRQELERRGF